MVVKEMSFPLPRSELAPYLITTPVLLTLGPPIDGFPSSVVCVSALTLVTLGPLQLLPSLSLPVSVFYSLPVATSQLLSS